MKYIGALDQGTTSTRFILFDESGTPRASHQIEHQQLYPQPGWVEHDPREIWKNSVVVIVEAMRKVRASAKDVAAIGITNQRETIVAWNPKTGMVWHDAIVWQDLRGTPIVERIKADISAEDLRKKTGLIHSPYFSASKIVWMLENVEGLRQAAEQGEIVFGTIDTWLVWNLTGGREGGVVVTDVTNASRYLLMDISTCRWDTRLLQMFNIPEGCLPTIVPSIGSIYGYTAKEGPLMGRVPVCGILGDQQAALFGQACFNAGEGKSTYGTGCFMLVNTGETGAIHSGACSPQWPTKSSGQGAATRWRLDCRSRVFGAGARQPKIVKVPPEVDVPCRIGSRCGVYTYRPFPVYSPPLA